MENLKERELRCYCDACKKFKEDTVELIESDEFSSNVCEECLNNALDYLRINKEYREL